MFLNPAGTEIEQHIFRKSKQVAGSIVNSSLRPFTDAQKFIVQLLCESYEEKLVHKTSKTCELYRDLFDAHEENNMLKAQLMLLRQTNKNLNAKLKESNNMIRILMKCSEQDSQEDGCLTTAAIDTLVDSKMKEIKQLSTGDSQVIKLAKPNEFRKKRKYSCIEDGHS